MGKNDIISMEPWSTPKRNIDISNAFTLGALLITVFILSFSTWAGGELPVVQINNTNLIYVFCILAVSLIAATSVQKYYASLGETKNAVIGTVLGTLLGVMLVFISMGYIPQFSTVSSNTAIAGLFVIIIIPIAEEKLFGRTLPFFLKGFISNGLVVLLLTCSAFSFYHVLTGAPLTSLLYSFIFRGVINVGNEKLKTSMFGNSLHAANNFVLVLLKLSRGLPI